MRKIVPFVVLLGVLFVLGNDAAAQCVMCKASVESASKMDAYTKGINNGILYMAAIPYILLSIIGYIWYKNYKKFKAEKEAKKVARKSKLKPNLS